MGFQLDQIATQKKEVQKTIESTSWLKKEITLFSKPFSNKVKEDFYTELSVLLKAGVTLREALNLIKSAQNKAQNKNILETIYSDIISGKSLSNSIKVHKSFTDYEFYSIKIGEETGTLFKVTEQLGSFFARKNEQRRNLISALTYPVIIMSTAVLVVAFMLRFVVPMFQDIFRQQNVDLPGITKFIINLSELLGRYGWFLLLILIGFLLANSLLKKNKRFKEIKDSTISKLPFVAKFVKLVYLSQFTQAVSLLTTSKVPVVNSIQLVKQMIDYYPLQTALETVEKNILKGQSLSQSLSQHKLFDDKMIALVKVAEETNQNDFIFERLNHQYSTQVQQKSKMLSTVLEPFIILIVGILVGVILVAMYLPMFKLSSVLG